MVGACPTATRAARGGCTFPALVPAAASYHLPSDMATAAERGSGSLYRVHHLGVRSTDPARGNVVRLDQRPVLETLPPLSDDTVVDESHRAEIASGRSRRNDRVVGGPGDHECGLCDGCDVHDEPAGGVFPSQDLPVEFSLAAVDSGRRRLPRGTSARDYSVPSA